MEKSFLKPGRETYGDKKIETAFQEAFAPYFDESLPALNQRRSIKGKNINLECPADEKRNSR